MLKRCLMSEPAWSPAAPANPLTESVEFRRLSYLERHIVVKVIKSILRRRNSKIVIYRFPFGMFAFFKDFDESRGARLSRLVRGNGSMKLLDTLRTLKRAVDSGNLEQHAYLRHGVLHHLYLTSAEKYSGRQLTS